MKISMNVANTRCLNLRWPDFRKHKNTIKILWTIIPNFSIFFLHVVFLTDNISNYYLWYRKKMFTTFFTHYKKDVSSPISKITSRSVWWKLIFIKTKLYQFKMYINPGIFSNNLKNSLYATKMKQLI